MLIINANTIKITVSSIQMFVNSIVRPPLSEWSDTTSCGIINLLIFTR